MTGTLARVGAITSWLVLILCALIDFTTTALLCVIVFWHRLGWLDRDLAGVVTVAITKYAILSV